MDPFCADLVRRSPAITWRHPFIPKAHALVYMPSHNKVAMIGQSGGHVTIVQTHYTCISEGRGGWGTLQSLE